MLIEVYDKKYEIGSSLYPVKDKKNIKIFTYENTDYIGNESISKFIDSQKFKSGFCYSNTDIIVKHFRELFIPVIFYSGWVFVGEHVPLHHAWAVYQNNVVDVSFRMSTIKVLNEVDYTNPNWREGAAMRIKAREKRIPLSQDCIMGKVFPNIAFVGSIDQFQLAKNRYNQMLKKFPNHPSYQNKDLKHGMTPFQREYNKLK